MNGRQLVQWSGGMSSPAPQVYGLNVWSNKTPRTISFMPVIRRRLWAWKSDMCTETATFQFICYLYTVNWSVCVVYSPVMGTNYLVYILTSVARYHGTTAAPRYHFSTVPVPSALRYYLVPQYHNYRGSSARYCLWHTVTNILLDCIVFGLKLQSSDSPLSFTAKLHTF